MRSLVPQKTSLCVGQGREYTGSSGVTAGQTALTTMLTSYTVENARKEGSTSVPTPGVSWPAIFVIHFVTVYLTVMTRLIVPLPSTLV